MFFYFVNEKFLLLLLLVPVFPVLYALARHATKRRMLRFGDKELVEQLIPSRSRSKGWVRLVLFDIAFLFFVIGLARPQLGVKLSERKTFGSEIIICLDVSNSMLAQDYTPNRLGRAKLAISQISDKLKDDRIGLVIFAGRSFVQLPVTSDYVSAKMFLENVSTESIRAQGTAIGDAIATASKGFSAKGERTKAIVVITDGENHEDDPVTAAAQAAEKGIKVYTIGVGSTKGVPIPMNGELLKDKDGEIVSTKLDEEMLKEIAEAGNGAYIHAGDAEFGLNPIISDLKELENENLNSVVFEEYDEQYMYFFAIALVFLILEMLVGERRARRRLFE